MIWSQYKFPDSTPQRLESQLRCWHAQTGWEGSRHTVCDVINFNTDIITENQPITTNIIFLSFFFSHFVAFKAATGSDGFVYMEINYKFIYPKSNVFLFLEFTFAEEKKKLASTAVTTTATSSVLEVTHSSLPQQYIYNQKIKLDISLFTLSVVRLYWWILLL